LSDSCHQALRTVAADGASRRAIERTFLDIGHLVWGMTRRKVPFAPCDLFITDHQEPAFDALASALEVRGSSGALGHLPIVMIAECDGPLVSRAAYKAGVTAFFPKPEPGQNPKALLNQLCLCIQLCELSGRADPALPLGVDATRSLH
jgi:CheY-like chemotaxis protein